MSFNSANSGVVVARSYAAGRVAHKHDGVSTALVYAETFGPKDRRWVLMHAPSLDVYEALDGWDADLVGGTATVLLPQTVGMMGTAKTNVDSVVTEQGLARFSVPVAQEQTSQELLLHSGNCGLLMLRRGRVRYEHRAEARMFARELAQCWNASLEGVATILLYEEAFGVSDTIHWLIHLKSLGAYYNLMGLRAQADPKAREVFTKQWVPAEKGGGGWDCLFVQSSLRDVALTPLREERP